MNDVNLLLTTLEEKIHNIIIAYKLIKQQNDQLSNEKNNLLEKIEEQNLIIKNLKTENEKHLLHKSESLEAAKVNSKIGSTIDGLIFEIDKCIEDLKL